MAFKPYGAMVLGHVATVSRIIDCAPNSRSVTQTGARWAATWTGEDNVLATDVSPAMTGAKCACGINRWAVWALMAGGGLYLQQRRSRRFRAVDGPPSITAQAMAVWATPSGRSSRLFAPLNPKRSK
jgi:hypothetical protein